jgi:hypothetical protein
VRQAWWCLPLVWGFGVLTGGLHVLALPLVLLAAAVYAGFVSSLGLYFSTVSRTTLRATLYTMLTLVALAVGPWVLAGGGDVLLEWWLPPDWVRAAGAFVRYGLSPPVTLWTVAFRFDGFVLGDREAMSGEAVLGALAGLACYALAAWALWRMALARFRAETFRGEGRGFRRRASGVRDQTVIAAPVPVTPDS